MTPTPTPPRPPSRLWLLPLLLIGGSALGWLIGWQLSARTLAVVLGVAVGVLASIPTTILLLAVVRRAAQAPACHPEPPPPPAPPTLVLNMADLFSKLPQPVYTPQPPVVIEGDARSIPGSPRIVGHGADDW